MLIKSATLLGLIALVSSATIHQRNIPVEVRYDEPVAAESVRNLNDQVQVVPVDLKETTNSLREESPSAEDVKYYGVRNLEEKVQLSPEDLGQALKHLPIHPDDDLVGAETAPLRQVEDTPHIEEITKQPDYIHSVLLQAEDIISNGLKKLRVSFKPELNQKVPDTEQWDKLEKAVNEYLNQEKIKLQLKQTETSTPPSNQNFFQNLASGFQTITNNFIQNLPGGGAVANATQGDEQQGQGPFQSFVNYFQGGVNNIANAINNLGTPGSSTSNTVLGDTGTATTQPPNFISSFVNNVQQFFGQLQGGSQSGGAPGTQGDTGVNNTVGGPQGPGQVIQTIGSAITNFIQGRPPGTSGDEGTATTQSSNIIQSIGSVIQNSPLNPFRPQQGQKPDEAAAGSTQNPIQAGISSVQNIGSQIQQLVSGQNVSSEPGKKPEDEAAPAENVEPQSQQQPISASNEESSEEPQNEITNSQASDDGTTRNSFTTNLEEIALVEQLTDKTQEVLTEATVEKEQEEPSKNENQLLETNLGETESNEVKQEELSQVVKLDEPKEEPLLLPVVLPTAIRQPEPFHIQLDQEEPLQVDIRQKEPLYGDLRLEEPLPQESSPAAVKEQKEEIMMTAE